MAAGADTENLDFEYTFYYTVNGATGVQTLSSYALDNSPLLFKPTVGEDWPDNLSNKRIVWDFGDGTTMEAITGKHVYKTPGQYKVRSYLYDNEGNGYFNTFSVTVNIYDFVEDKIVLDVDKNTCSLEYLVGEFKTPISITQFNSARTFERNNRPVPVLTYADSKSFEREYGFFESGRSQETYGHLLPSHNFIQRINNGTDSIAISAVRVESYDNIYATASGDVIIPTSEKVNETSIFAGVSSTNEVFFKSDMPGFYNLYFGFEQGDVYDFTNTTTYGVSAKICDNFDYDSLSITTNGIDGDNVPIDTFNINSTKFGCTEISFVVQVKDSERFSVRSLPLLILNIRPEQPLLTEREPLSVLDIESEIYHLITEGDDYIPTTMRLTDGVTVYEDAIFDSSFASMSSTLLPSFYNAYAGGFLKGNVKINTTEVLKDVWLEAEITIPENFGELKLPPELVGKVVTGKSNKFDIYPKDYYVVAKQGEDIDFKDIFKDVAIQPLFADTRMLMNDFIGSIFGDIDSAQDSLGKSTYEKIQNFFDNNAVIDYANIDQLASILQSYNLPKINKYSLPPKIKRLLDLLSISQTRLFGNINQNKDDFNSFGYLNTDNYGVDRCKPIPKDGVVFAGYEIVAFEKFSGKWTSLNTMLPLCASDAPTVSNFSINPLSNDGLTCFDLASCTPLATEDLTTMLVEGEYFEICVSGSYVDGDFFSTSTVYYQLSDYNESWGWPLILDADGTLFDVYEFYYKPQNREQNIEGSIINFKDNNTTINTRYTHTDWVKKNGVMSNIFANALYDGLELFDCDEED